MKHIAILDNRWGSWSAYDVKADENVLAEDGLPDITKVKPFIFDPIHQGYTGLGSFLGKAFSVGKRK